MMEQLEVLGWQLNVDREATRKVYAQPLVYSCKCLYCRKFMAVRDQLPDELRDLCHILDIDVNQPSEVCQLFRVSEDPDIYSYVGWYHLVGKITSSPENVVVNGRVMKYTVQLTENTIAYFDDEHLPGEDDFPKPVFALEFSTTIPWVLDEKP